MKSESRRGAGDNEHSQASSPEGGGYQRSISISSECMQVVASEGISNGSSSDRCTKSSNGDDGGMYRYNNIHIHLYRPPTVHTTSQ